MEATEQEQQIVTEECPLKLKAEKLKSLGLNQNTIAFRLNVTPARISQLIGKRRKKKLEVPVLEQSK